VRLVPPALLESTHNQQVGFRGVRDAGVLGF
jgi:hypothetical protein